MSKKLTKDQLLDILSERISQHMAKLTLENTKRGLESQLEAFDLNDYLWSDAPSAAKADIEGEYGADEFSPLGNHEDPKQFVKGLTKAKESDVDSNAADWKANYAQFNELLTSHLTQDAALAQLQGEDPNALLDAMAVAMYKYMMDHNSRSPFISSIQQWIIDLDDQFDPTNEEGDIELDPMAMRVYRGLASFEKLYNRKYMAKKAGVAQRVTQLKEQRKRLLDAVALVEGRVREDGKVETHYKVVFMQGEEAYEPLEIMDQQGNHEALQYLMQWEGSDESGEAYDEPIRGTMDREYREVIDGDTYIMNWNSGIPYIGLSRMVVSDAPEHDDYSDLYGDEVVKEDIDDMDLDGGDLTDDLDSAESMETLADVSHGFYVVPPTAEDPYWYVVNQDDEPVEGFNTEEQAKAALSRLESETDLMPSEPEQGVGYGTLYKESRLERMERLLNEASTLLKEYAENYPVGADSDPQAPWNQESPVPLKKKPMTAFTLVDANDECLIVQHGGVNYVMNLDALGPDEIQRIAIDHVDGSAQYDSDKYGASDLPAEAVVDYLNANFSTLKIGEGLAAWENGMDDLVKIDDELAQSLLTDYPTLSFSN